MLLGRGRRAAPAKHALAASSCASELEQSACAKLTLRPPSQQTRTATRSTGSGVFIERRGDVCQVLTAAHVVANSTFIQVQLAGQPDKLSARVTHVAHETDLALVEVPASLFEGVEPLPVAPIDALPSLREKVYVLGFPVGGDDLSSACCCIALA